MKLSKFTASLFLFVLEAASLLPPTFSANSNLFRSYIGAEFNHVEFTDVPINPHVDFHFILSFAIDYTTSSPHRATDGRFNVFWDEKTLSPLQVRALKARHPNVKVALSLGGNSVGKSDAYFQPTSVDTWLSNAVPSLTEIIEKYHLDGIDVDYEHFNEGPEIFAECVGKLLSALKRKKVISFASIAPYDDDDVQRHYLSLWRRYGHLIDYVNFQFYAYDEGTTVSEFMGYFAEQSSNYGGGKVLASFTTDGSGGLSPERGFFAACEKLKRKGELHGIFVWSADDSKKLGFKYEKKSQSMLAV